jgi:energy-coupling factor transporter ATP-binding protein EcfA2
VAIRDLVVRYPGSGVNALSGITLEVGRGELVGLIGLNGAGKTTLCRCLNGIVPQLVEADVEGSVTVAGIDALGTPVRRMASVVGMVLDEPSAQLSQGSAGEEVALGLESMAIPYNEMVARVDAALERAGLAGLAARPPDTLSGGQRQRLVLASAIAMRPPLLVLDEPTAGLDPRARARVFELLAELASDGTATIVVEHDVELLAEVADRLLVLDRGRLVADGTPAAVLGDAARMESAGIRVPDVTVIASALGLANPLPVTYADAVHRLADRA